MALRALHSTDQPTHQGVPVAQVMPTMAAPVGVPDRNLVPTRDALNLVCHFQVSHEVWNLQNSQ